MTDQNGGASAPAEAQATPDVIDKYINEATEAQPEEVKSEAIPAEEPKEDLWPKKAVNALAKAKGAAAREKAVRQQLEREIAQLREAKPETKPTGAPKEEDFAGKPYGEYLAAVNKYQIDQTLSERDKKSSQELSTAKQKEWESERDSEFDENLERASESFRDFDEVMAKNVRGKPLAPHVVKAFREADDPAYALYALAKDGMYDSLNEMSETQLMKAITRAGDKAIAQTKTKPVTNAPQPMSANKGTAVGDKSADSMSGKQLLKWVYST